MCYIHPPTVIGETCSVHTLLLESPHVPIVLPLSYTFPLVCVTHCNLGSNPPNNTQTPSSRVAVHQVNPPILWFFPSSVPVFRGWSFLFIILPAPPIISFFAPLPRAPACLVQFSKPDPTGLFPLHFLFFLGSLRRYPFLWPFPSSTTPVFTCSPRHPASHTPPPPSCAASLLRCSFVVNQILTLSIRFTSHLVIFFNLFACSPLVIIYRLLALW